MYVNSGDLAEHHTSGTHQQLLLSFTEPLLLVLQEQLCDDDAHVAQLQVLVDCHLTHRELEYTRNSTTEGGAHTRMHVCTYICKRSTCIYLHMNCTGS